jgi:CelD/BcsL family acetyltransferase involved in cellulose biosynthesis
MSNVELISDAADLQPLREIWERLLASAQFYYPTFEQIQRQLSTPGARGCVAAVRNGQTLSGITCFGSGAAMRAFTIGERKLFALPVEQVAKIGFQELGAVDREQWLEIIDAVMSRWRFTVLDLGEVVRGSALHQATERLSHTLLVARGRKPSIRWFIDVPATFDEYLDALRPSTKRNVTYKLRRFEREQAYEFVTISRPEQVEQFLHDGEAVSRRTYQWALGQRLENTEQLRSHYQRLAEQGRLRCHLLYIDGVPAGFMRNELHAGICNYGTPGFDPLFEKCSPGLVMLLWTIKDLIENTDCRVFDFGEGGDDQGYKSRFGTRSIECDYIHVYPARKPYSLLIYLAERALTLTKNLADAIIGDSSLRQKLKKAIRKYGVEEPPR